MISENISLIALIVPIPAKNQGQKSRPCTALYECEVEFQGPFKLCKLLLNVLMWYPGLNLEGIKNMFLETHVLFV